jgi:AcrR family transcriptional regulator
MTATKREDIVRAAQELFGEVGFEKTGVREIALRAHVAVGTIYKHFGTGKVGVLEAALADAGDRLTGIAATSDQSDPLEAFLDRAGRLNRAIVRDPFLRRVIREQDRVAEPRLREQGRAIAEMFATVGIRELRRLIRQGAVRCEDPQAVQTLLRSATAGWMLWEGTGIDQASHDRMLNTLLTALRTLLLP